MTGIDSFFQPLRIASLALADRIADVAPHIVAAPAWQV
jgi:hypothetical protein